MEQNGGGDPIDDAFPLSAPDIGGDQQIFCRAGRHPFVVGLGEVEHRGAVEDVGHERVPDPGCGGTTLNLAALHVGVGRRVADPHRGRQLRGEADEPDVGVLAAVDLGGAGLAGRRTPLGQGPGGVGAAGDDLLHADDGLTGDVDGDDLIAAVRGLRPQDPLELQYFRDQKPRTVTATLKAGDPQLFVYAPAMG